MKTSRMSSSNRSFDGDDYDEPVRMASESLVVKSYKDAESSTISTTTSHGDKKFEEFQIYQGVMGRPGIDFPVYPNIPPTNFNCRGVKKSGYYADLATDCQVFHICDGNRKISFLCPNGTIFRQSHLICDWWFRVDCGKSVDLYEESAEQLAADQKIYRARSEEREKRRKLGKTLAGENAGELTSSEVFALDEPFQIKGRKGNQQNQNQFVSSTVRTTVGRKGERHSKKVVDSGSTEKFPAYTRNQQTERVLDNNRYSDYRQQYTTSSLTTKEPKVSFVENRNNKATTPFHSTPIQTTRYQVQNNVNFGSNQEKIQLAESGSLVEDLNKNRNQNFDFNNKKPEQNIDFTRNNNFAFNGNQKSEEKFINFNNGATYNENKRTDHINNNNNNNNQNSFGAYNYNANQNTQNFAYNAYQKVQEQTANYNSRKVTGNNNFNYNKNAGQSSNFNRNNNFAYNNKETEQTNLNNQTSTKNYSYFNNPKTQEQIADINTSKVTSNVSNNSNSNVDQTSNFGSNGNFGYNNNKETISYTNINNQNGNSQFSYNERQKLDKTYDNTYYNKNNIASTTTGVSTTVSLNNARGKTDFAINSGGSKQTYENNNKNGFEYNQAQNQGEDLGVTSFTTEFAHYESKRTNPIERQETITPTSYTKKTQSSRYRSSTPSYEEQEKQYLAETASFAGNRGSKSFFDYQNQFNTYDKSITKTPDTYKTTYYQQTQGFSTTQKPLSSATQNFDQYSTLADLYRTTTYRPVKQHSRKVTLFPSTFPQTTGNVWQTTTYQPLPEITTNDKFTSENVYFTTTAPENEVDIVTENNRFGVFQKQENVETEFDYSQSTPKPEVDITLQELSINKGVSSTESNNQTYSDYTEEDLKSYPSPTPNALTSFALYFSTNNNNNNDNQNIVNVEETQTIANLPVAGDGDLLTSTLDPFEAKKKEVLKQVDELMHGSAINATEQEVSHHDNTLPSSLTLNTKDGYSALFPNEPIQNQTNTAVVSPVTDKETDFITRTEFETTAFESYTEEPQRINKELTKNDLEISQSRGLVEPDPHSDTDYSKVSPDLRELAQVFTKALSAYLDDPEAFRKVLSEIRPTEPSMDTELSSSNPLEYPSATQEDDEVLDFSDVTKATYKKKASTVSNFQDKSTEYVTEAPTTNPSEIENLVLPLNQTSWATNIELTAPLFESLDQSQSSYYTAPPYIGTTNAIAEEINNEFTGNESLPSTDSNETIDSYLPIRGSVDDPSLPRYGGFQNNSNPTTKYSPYGAELTSTTYLPYGADLTSTASPNTAATAINENRATTFNPNNVTAFLTHFSKNESAEEEIQLAKELNTLVLFQKYTTPKGLVRESTTQEPNLSTVHLGTQNDISQYQNVHLGNGEILEKNIRGGKSLQFPESDINSNYFEPNPKEINLELSPPSSTPKGFLITYSIGSTSSEPATYLPKATTPEIKPTTYSPKKDRIATTFPPEVQNSNQRIDFANFDSNSKSATEFYTTIVPTTISFGQSTKSFERLAQLQETLMFNTNNLTVQQKDQARVSVEEVMGTLNVTDSTANTLMKVMEMAAKNETYRRLVLLLVNDKSGKNKTIEEARLSLLKALLTPVINPQQTRTVLPISEISRIDHIEPRPKTNSRRSKSIKSETTRNIITTTPPAVTAQKTSNKRIKTGRGLVRAESTYSKSGLGNLGLIRRTIENSKNKQVRVNSLDDAILDSDSRAVELLKSLYSLAARWG